MIEKSTGTMKETLKIFGESTSVKGVPKILKTKETFLRIVWFIAVILGATVAFYQITTLIVRYFQYESVTKLQYCNDCKPPFPDITVCNLNPLNSLTEYKDKIQDFDSYMDYIDGLSYSLDLPQLQTDLNLTYNQLNDVYNEAFSLTGYFQNINRTVVQSLVNLKSTNNLIKKCTWYGWDRKQYPKENCRQNSIYTFYSPEYFVCYTLHMNDSNKLSNNKEISSLYAVLYLNDFAEKLMRTMVQNIYQTQARGLRVQVHPPNTLPDMAKGFNIPAGHEVQIRLSARRNVRLGEPYAKCSDQVYFDETESKKNDPYSVKYKFTDKACLSLCHQEHNLRNCLCFNPHLPFSANMKSKYSHLPECGWVGSNIEDAIKRVSCFLYVSDNTADNITCECVQPCNQYSYNYQLLQSPWPHEAYHDSFYWSVIDGESYRNKFEIYRDINKVFLAGNFTEGFALTKDTDLIERNFIQLKVLFQDEGHDIYTDIPAVTFDAFFGSMGGILNLWIGITFFTLIEIFELGYRLVESLSSRKKHPSTETTMVKPFNDDEKKGYTKW